MSSPLCISLVATFQLLACHENWWKIQKLDFIEIHELLPKMCVSDTHNIAPSSCKGPHRAPVTNILVSMECFAMMAAVWKELLSKGAQLRAYLQQTVHGAWNYQGSAWVVYDWLYQKWALSQQRLDWMQEDPSSTMRCFPTKQE